MDINRFTEMARQALNTSQIVTGEYGHQQIESEHLLLALLRQDKGTVPQILAKMNIDLGTFLNETESALSRKPRVSGSGSGGAGAVYLSAGLNSLMTRAETEAGGLKDDYVSTEHLFMAVLEDDGDAGALLKSHGVTKNEILKALKQIRGNQRVTSQNPEATYQALERYAVDLTERARQGKLDPVIGRDDEIRRVIQVLSRRTKTTPYSSENRELEKPR